MDVVISYVIPTLGAIISQCLYLSTVPLIISLRSSARQIHNNHRRKLLSRPLNHQGAEENNIDAEMVEEFQVQIPSDEKFVAFDEESVNPFPFVAMVLVALSNFLYGLLIRNYFVAVANSLALILTIWMLSSVYSILIVCSRSDRTRLILETILFAGISIVTIGHIVIFITLAEDLKLATTLSGAFALATVIMLYSSPLSTIVNVIKNRNATQIYLPLAIASLLNGSLWASYGAFAVNDPVIWFPNSIGILSSLIQIALKRLF